MKRLPERLAALEASHGSNDGQRAVMAAMRDKLNEAGLTDDKRQLIQAVIHQNGIINFSQMKPAADLGVGGDLFSRMIATAQSIPI